MTRLVKFPVAEGSDEFVVVEVEDAGAPPGPRRAGRGDETAERARKSLEQAIQGVRPLAEGILGQLQSLTHAPDAVSLDLGIKLNADVGVVLASAASEGHCKITVTWGRCEGHP